MKTSKRITAGGVLALIAKTQEVLAAKGQDKLASAAKE